MNTQALEAPADMTAWGPEAVADFLDISVRALLNLRTSDESFPEPRMIGRLPRWAPHAILRWLAREPDPASETPARKLGRKASKHVK